MFKNQEYKYNWLDHVSKIENTSIPKVIMSYKPRRH